MEISPLIIEYLKENGSAAVPGFGAFSLQKIGASYSKESDRILPPAKQIIFSPDYDAQHFGLIDFIAKKNSVSTSEAAAELQKLTDFWKNKIAAAESFEISGLGKFSFAENEMHFSGEKITTENPDFYGLEEISISNLKKKKKGNFLWPTLVVLIIIGGIAAFSLLNPELLFGKKSFPDRPKTEKVPAKKPSDSLAKVSAPKMDSTKIKDSLARAAKPVYKPKYYKKHTWKQRKHRNR